VNLLVWIDLSKDMDETYTQDSSLYTSEYLSCYRRLCEIIIIFIIIVYKGNFYSLLSVRKFLDGNSYFK
jgi:hypothetical protein